MNLKHLEYANFVLNSIIKDRPVEKFVYYNALNGLIDFLKIEKTREEELLVYFNTDVIKGVSRIFQIYYDGGSCLKGIVEANYLDFNNLVEDLIALGN